MKMLKRFLCLLFIVPLFGLCVACKNDGDKNGGGENAPLTTAQIMKYVSNEFLVACGTQDGGLGHLDDGVYDYPEYDEYMFISAKMIDALANTQGVQLNAWTKGEVRTLIGKTEYANRVSKLKIAQTEESGQVEIVIDILFEIADLPIADNGDSYDFWHYEISYNRESKASALDVVIEKSRNYEDADFEQDSKAKYIKIKYDSSEIVTTAFERTADISNLENSVLYTKDVIKDVSYIKYNLVNKSIVRERDLYPDPVNTPALYQAAQNLVLESVSLKQNVMTAVTSKDHLSLTHSLINLANAEKIADIL